MYASFPSFAISLTLSVALLYLILVARFRSCLDPLIILLALLPGITGLPSPCCSGALRSMSCR